MGHWFEYVITFVFASAAALWLTPHVRDAALRFGILDRPDGMLKRHLQPIPYLGGLAIYLAFLITVASIEGVLPSFGFRPEVLGMSLAASLIVIVGLVDDLGQLSPRVKLAGQSLAIWVLIKSGVSIQLAFLPRPVCILLTFLWMLAVINAFNLIDIMDGLSAGTAAVASVGLIVLAEIGGGTSAAVLLAAMAGACVGFLAFNFDPARIYMGDMGSMFLGLMLGAVSMDNAYTHHTGIGALAPVLVLGVPLFDMCFVMAVRWSRGDRVMQGSPDHVALRLRRAGLTTQQIALGAYGVTALLCAAAIALTVTPFWVAMWIVGSVGFLALLASVALLQV